MDEPENTRPDIEKNNHNGVQKNNTGNHFSSGTDFFLKMKLLSALFTGAGVALAASSKSKEWDTLFTTGVVFICIGAASYLATKICSWRHNHKLF